MKVYFIRELKICEAWWKSFKKYIAKTRNLVYCIFKCKIHTHEIDNEGEENGHKDQRLYY